MWLLSRLTFRGLTGMALTQGISLVKKPMATEAHGKHGIFTDDFWVFRGFRGYLSRFRLVASAIRG
jgi:hypothetical protein